MLWAYQIFIWKAGIHHKKIYLGWEKYPTQVSGKLVTSGLVNVQKTNIEHFLKFSRENLELDEKKAQHQCLFSLARNQRTFTTDKSDILGLTIGLHVFAEVIQALEIVYSIYSFASGLKHSH